MNLLASNTTEDNRRWANNSQPAGGATVPRWQLSTEGQRASSPASGSDELDGPLYDRVLERVRSSGVTVRAEDVLGDLDDDGASTSAD